MLGKLSFVGILLWSLVSVAWSCPMCSAVPLTLAEELEQAEAVVVATPSGSGKYKIEKVLKGKGLAPGRLVTGAPAPASMKQVILFTVTPPTSPFWTGPPLATDPTLVKFLTGLMKLPRGSNPTVQRQRLKYFLPYLGHANSDLADSAYGEFAAADYEEVIRLAPSVGRPKLLAWLESATTPDAHRALYLIMLGSFRNSADLPLVEKLLSQAETNQSGTDQASLIACYLSLKGSGGLARIERNFLDPDLSPAAHRAALEALRFHGNLGDPIESAQVAAVFRRQLQQPALAGLVLRDLALWKDWKALDDVVALYNSSQEAPWVRIPVIRYLSTCPLPEAKTALERFRKDNPDLVEAADRPFKKF